MKRKRIVVIGAGGMAREVASAICWINRHKPTYDFLGYVVSDLSKLGARDSTDQVLGDFRWLQQNRKCVALALGVGAPAARLRLASELDELLPGIEWPVLIHPTAVIDLESAKLGEGCFIGARVVATVNIELDAFALCNFGTTLGHEARVGRGSVINPGANIAGGVVLGEGVAIGSGAQVLQYLHVGTGAVVGAGAVVTRNVPGGITVVGVPARPRAIVEETALHEHKHYQI